MLFNVRSTALIGHSSGNAMFETRIGRGVFLQDEVLKAAHEDEPEQAYSADRSTKCLSL